MTEKEKQKRESADASAVHTEFNMNREDFAGGLNGVSVNREYKDRIFRMVFKEKREFLELYNAMNGTHYDNPDDLVVTTLDNAIYMGMKNDVSFMLYDQLLLYEHQSTRNPNMPLRDLFYVADMYSALLKRKRLYSSSLIRVPAARFVTFFNGADDAPDVEVLKLSDAFFTPEEDPQLELKVTVLNINEGHNRELMNRCRTLSDYMQFVTRVRKYSKTMILTEAVNRAVDECIAEGILEDFLRKNREEVIKTSIYEYDAEEHMQMIREESMAEGWKEGEAKGLKEGEAKGRKEGEAKGRKEGEAKGRKEGEAKGRKEGEAKGRKEGEAIGEIKGGDKVAALFKKMSADGRIDEFARSVDDRDFRRQLLAEYGLDQDKLK